MAVQDHIAVRADPFDSQRFIDRAPARTVKTVSDASLILADDPIVRPDFGVAEFILRIRVQLSAGQPLYQ